MQPQQTPLQNNYSGNPLQQPQPMAPPNPTMGAQYQPQPQYQQPQMTPPNPTMGAQQPYQQPQQQYQQYQQPQPMTSPNPAMGTQYQQPQQQYQQPQPQQNGLAPQNFNGIPLVNMEKEKQASLWLAIGSIVFFFMSFLFGFFGALGGTLGAFAIMKAKPINYSAGFVTGIIGVILNICLLLVYGVISVVAL